MANKAEHFLVGIAGEDAASAYIRSLGWRIAHRNWRPAGAARGLELDIVAMDGEVLVFVEVKSRRRQGRAAYGPQARAAQEPHAIPVHAAFTPEKCRRLLRAARLYLSAGDLWLLPCRFDYIGVEWEEKGRPRLEHQRHVIEIGHLVDCGHSAWQPW